MQDLAVTLIQTHLHWQDKTKNLEHFLQLVGTINQPTDLIILPEMFNTGFSMSSSSLYETMNGQTVKWMKEIANEKNATLIGSLIIKHNDAFYNRLIVASADGSIEAYDKKHLFRMAGEDENFSPGTEKLIVEINGWRICPLICYDLRFPVWSRNKQDYDCLIYIANWPTTRKTAWNDLLKARAHENLSYVVGVNRIGRDGNDIEYNGDSAAINYKGEILSDILPKEEKVETIHLSSENLLNYRSKFAAHLDADKFELI